METVSSFGLGLDQGVASIGWAIVRVDSSGKPAAIERLGVHLFEAGTEGDIEGGRDESRAGPRRMARQLRRQFRRRVLRKRRLLRWLQELGLMPNGNVNSPEGRDKLLKGLDAELRETWEVNSGADHRLRQLLPYRLRAAGLTRRLEPFELGRALYHLAQRRGYLSNRKQAAANAHGEGKAEEDTGTVREAIVELERQMRGAGCRTLAEYFSTLDPAGVLSDRLRGRWTAREMFLEEFERLFAEQAKHHACLTAEARQRLHRAIFFQRPLRGVAGLIGECELVRGKKRCPIGHRLAQRFRLLQRVNDLEIRLPDHSRRALTRDERERLLKALDHEGDIAFSKLKTKQWFGLPKGASFNLEEGGEKRIVGNRTEAKCRAIFGAERWDSLADVEKDAVVQDLLLFEKPAALAKRGVAKWKLPKQDAERLGDCVLEPGYSSHCAEALAVLIERMEEGTPYATAVREEFPAHLESSEPLDLLPPVERALGTLRNPALTRALTELRKLVNAVVRKFGKPAWIRLELSRDLKRARKHRERMSAEMRAQEERRENARARILKEAGVPQISRSDVERVLLAEECGWLCPYTGKAFAMADIVGRHPQVDVEHIWPLSRSLDDSFLNKTLCYVQENRDVKKNRTPFEAYGQSERWQDITDRVKRFRGDAGRIKLERFLSHEIPDDFAQRHLAETRQIGASSAGYLGLLFGGEIDASHRRRVFVTTGGLTAHLRREWGLNGLLSDDREKSRDDHRHHAIDALVVALTDTRAVQVLQKAAEEASAAGRRLFAPLEAPWPRFAAEAKDRLNSINVSYRQSRRVSGKLHAESNYSRPIGPAGERRIRKELSKLTEKEVARIVDPKVRRAVEEKIRELGLKPKGTAKQYTDFADRNLHPFTPTKSGGQNWIHKVRIVVSENPRSVGRGARKRFVASTKGTNHHTVIARMDDGTWKDRPVQLADISPSARLLQRPHGCREFTLAAGEFVLLKDESGADRLLRITKLSEGQIAMIGHADGRRIDEIKKGKGVVYRSGSSLVRGGARKVMVTYLGEIRRAGG